MSFMKNSRQMPAQRSKISRRTTLSLQQVVQFTRNFEHFKDLLEEDIPAVRPRPLTGRSLCAVQWERVIVDGIQDARNASTLYAQTLFELPAKQRTATTNSNILNDYRDLYSICARFLRLPFLSNSITFECVCENAVLRVFRKCLG